jgi:DNA-binding NarL/FixJ family response regulator
MGMALTFISTDLAEHTSVTALREVPGMEVSVVNGMQLPERQRNEAPEIIIIEAGGTGKDLVPFLQEVQRSWNGIPMMVVADMPCPDKLTALFSAGVRAVLLREEAGERLPEAVSQVLAGNHYLSAPLLAPLFTYFTRKKQTLKEMGLTRRQTEIAGYLMQGLSYKEIARQNYIAIDTLNTHVRNIYSKLGVHSALELVAKYG